jgi:hypothetical protein
MCSRGVRNGCSELAKHPTETPHSASAFYTRADHALTSEHESATSRRAFAVGEARWVMEPIHVSAFERFRTLGVRGEGATSRVFEVEDRLHRGRFALKQLRGGSSFSAERVARFTDEFRIFERMSHPMCERSISALLPMP